jgi:hypothetical protein
MTQGWCRHKGGDKGGDRQDVPHEVVSEGFLSSDSNTRLRADASYRTSRFQGTSGLISFPLNPITGEEEELPCTFHRVRKLYNRCVVRT